MEKRVSELKAGFPEVMDVSSPKKEWETKKKKERKKVNEGIFENRKNGLQLAKKN